MIKGVFDSQQEADASVSRQQNLVDAYAYRYEDRRETRDEILRREFDWDRASDLKYIDWFFATHPGK